MGETNERVVQRRNSCLLLQDVKTSKVLGPIIGYAQEPLLPLTDACEPLVNIVDDILKYVSIALAATPNKPPDNLTKDEAASIYLYSLEWEGEQKSLYSILNGTLRTADRQDLQPWFKYIKLFLTAVAKIPCARPQTVWRGVRRNISDEFPPGAQVTWWSFSSCTTSLTVLESDMFLGNTGERTLFSIELFNGRIIRSHSHFDTEDEILMLPGTYMEVQSQFTPAPDLHIIHLKQVIPKEILLETPFKGARLYPKPERPWYRKKRFALLAAVLVVVIILGSIFGSRSITKISVLASTNITNVIDIAPANLTYYQEQIDRSFIFTITGAIDGRIYGTNIYTDDSNIATAAVHAGVLRVGETKNITIKILPDQASYVGSTQNGISSFSCDSWGRSYSFSDTLFTSNMTPSNLANYSDKINQIFTFKVTGADDDFIYGTNIYTDDSDLDTAAVHAGVLRIGETKNITIKILPGQPSYTASTQNGISSFSYGSWTRSYSFVNVV